MRVNISIQLCVSRGIGLRLICCVLILTLLAASLWFASAATQSLRGHWAFQPLKAQVPASGSNAFRNTGRFEENNLIDRFINHTLESKGLSASPLASPTKRLRRIAIGLTGLPPSLEELNRFESEAALGVLRWERWIDYYLASPHYGERWGRHWLDVARYADSNGQDENKAMSNAWRYRDYVVGSLNQDKPFDRFILEQLAGDLLTNEENSTDSVERLIATGFLVMGPKMLAEQDKQKLVMDVVDEQIDTIGRALLGLTLSCARCHDHKYDPIPTEDYYGLAGILKSTRSMKNLDFVSQWSEVSISSKEHRMAIRAHEARLKELQSNVDKLVSRANSELTNRTRQALPKDPRSLYSTNILAELKQAESARDQLNAEAPMAEEFAMAVAEETTTDVPVHIRGNHLTLASKPTPRGLPSFVRHDLKPTLPLDRSGRLELAQWLASSANPLTARVIVNRIWAGHFGQGLVKTADNFGIRGESPSHPELLDWLAQEFIRSGWSLKHVHRLILSSTSFHRSSQRTAEQKSIDPENRWLSAFPRQRFDAEAVRDGLLYVSGLLDTQMGGSLVSWKNNEYVPGGDEKAFDSNRRAIYLPIVRDRVNASLSVLDFPNPSVGVSQRTSTIVAHQALFHLNSDFVKKSAAALAKRIRSLTGPDEKAQIRSLFRIVMSRSPNESEMTSCQDFLNSQRSTNAPESEAAVAAFQALCHTVLASNEFNHRE